MALNQRYPEGKHIALPADKDYKSGQPVKIGSITGVALIDAKAGEKVTIWRDGSFVFPIDAAVTVGAPVYLVSGAIKAAGTDVFGYALNATSGAGEVEVLLKGNL
ncbi:capsid cement protein [Rothia amarae]|uniref:capsid cement protein n=1 Tax=Rothia amarae TaxID=169480 RepID=UPI00119E96F0